MVALELHARNFMLQCRASSRRNSVRVQPSRLTAPKSRLFTSCVPRRLPASQTKPYYVTSPIFYVNAGEPYSSTTLQKSQLTRIQHLMPAIYTPLSLPIPSSAGTVLLAMIEQRY